MMLLILLLLQSRALASTSKGMMFAPSICNIKFSSCSVYKTTGSYALSCVPDMQRKTSHWDELSSKSSAQAVEGSFLDRCASAVTKLLFRAMAGSALVWCLPDISGDCNHLSQQRGWANKFIPLQGGCGASGPIKCALTLSSLITAIIEVRILIHYPGIWYTESEGAEPATVAVQCGHQHQAELKAGSGMLSLSLPSTAWWPPGCGDLCECIWPSGNGAACLFYTWKTIFMQSMEMK